MKNKNYLLTSLIIAGLVASCAKERELDTVYKAPELESKSAINTEAEFLYVPTSQGVPRFTKAMAPFVQGNERIVKFKFEEEGIVAYEMEKETEFQDNTLNNKPILTIPVTYKSYRCAENADDECTNREEENTELEWFQKDNFVPNFEEVKVLEADSLGLPESGDPCYSLQATKLVDYKVTNTDVNFEIEKTYKFSSSDSCMNELWYSSGSEYDKFLESLDDNGAFNTRVFFSFAKLDTIASSNYKDIAYPVEDHGVFGFFKTKERTKNAFGQTERTYKLNRWNPEKTVVDYYLSDEFSKKENAYLKEASIFAFNRMNKMLEMNDVKLRLKLHMPANKKAGNLRNTMVVLIEDIASGLLGYGPTVANPRTGEIVKGHVNMYKGSLESIAPSAYDSIVFLDEQVRKAENNTASIQSSLATTRKKLSNANITSAVKNILDTQVVAKNHDGHDHAHDNTLDLNKNEDRMGALRNFKGFKKSISKRLSRNYQELVLSKVNGQLNEFTKDMKDSLEIKEILHRNSVYTTDMFNFQALGKASVEDIYTVPNLRDANGNLKDWIQLEESQQKQLIEILARHAYIPTLVHEIGHNLGLRHNFRGSLDAQNFYNNEERAKLGLTSGSVFSSIMDYSYSSLNELTTFGKYDIAALTYGYNRKVEVKETVVKDDKTVVETKRLVSLDEAPEDKTLTSYVGKNVSEINNRVPYLFCTDEDVSMYADCNRFDEGSNDLELTKHYATKYKEYYQWRNKKGRSKNFNDTLGTWRYYLGTYYNLLDLRQAHETWQFYKAYLAQYDLDRIMDNKCTAVDRANMEDFCETLDQVVEANEVATQTLLEIVKTPDLTCDVYYQVISNDTNEELFSYRTSVNFAENTQYKSYPLANGTGDYRPTSCFDKNAKSDIVEEQGIKAPIYNVCAQTHSAEICNEGNTQFIATVIGQVGKPHNDVDAAPRDGERLETDDIEIRGNWLDKVLAMEILTNRDRLTSAGESIHGSFTDMAKYKDEIKNIFDHLALNKTLSSPLAGETESGIKYQLPWKTDLHVKTKVPTIKRHMKQFIPFSDTKDFDIAPVLLKVAAINSFESEEDSESLSQYVSRSEFFDSLVVRRNNIASSDDAFGPAVVATTNVHNFQYGATARNTLAVESISRINGMTAGIATQIEAMLRDLSKVEAPQEVTTAETIETETTEVAATEETEVDPAEEAQAAKEEIVEITEEVRAKLNEIITLKTNISFHKKTVDRIYGIYATMSDNSPQTMERIQKEIGALRQEVGAPSFDSSMSLINSLSNIQREDPRYAQLSSADLYDLEYAAASPEERKAIQEKEIDAIWALPIVE